MSTFNVGVVIVNDFTLTAFSGFIEVLRLARDYGNDSDLNISWLVMSEDNLPRKSSSGIVIQPGSGLLNEMSFDYVVVCGGNDYWNPGSSRKLLSYLKSFNNITETKFIGICTGTFYLAAADIINKQRVCIHWNALDDFSKQFPHIKASANGIFIEDNNILTCAGAMAAIDMALFLINRHFGYHKMKQVVRHMIMNDMRKPSIPQAHFYDYLSLNVDERVRRAIQIMERNLDKSQSIKDIANALNISSKQLERIFIKNIEITPYRLHRQIRLNYAAWLIRNTNSSITNIAGESGFADTAHLAREFKRLHQVTPLEYRAEMQFSN